MVTLPWSSGRDGTSVKSYYSLLEKKDVGGREAFLWRAIWEVRVLI